MKPALLNTPGCHSHQRTPINTKGEKPGSFLDATRKVYVHSEHDVCSRFPCIVKRAGSKQWSRATNRPRSWCAGRVCERVSSHVAIPAAQLPAVPLYSRGSLRSSTSLPRSSVRISWP
ncbi:unnamed protein product, partial [Scytosiphon promiscuus]